jgi:hypothetical protein
MRNGRKTALALHSSYKKRHNNILLPPHTVIKRPKLLWNKRLVRCVSCLPLPPAPCRLREQSYGVLFFETGTRQPKYSITRLLTSQLKPLHIFSYTVIITTGYANRSLGTRLGFPPEVYICYLPFKPAFFFLGKENFFPDYHAVRVHI